ncbi:hypothetical protein M0805_003020 [Coniferiporia weirii]|nr:hypothetical protein M0805_003020 [Coniferiporia weirii]
MSQTVPSSFDPFAMHHFTNINNIPPQAPAPYAYPRPVPTTHSYGHQYSSHAPPAPSAPSSLPTAQTPVYAPQPVRASPPGASPQATHQPVFEPFRLERASPDLQDVLAKKSTSGKRSKASK